MSRGGDQVAPSMRALPKAGVVRLHHDPAILPKVHGEVGHNRFDDPRVGTIDRYVVRYTATTLRGCLLESLDWLRPDGEANAAEAEVVENAEPDVPTGELAPTKPWAG